MARVRVGVRKLGSEAGAAVPVEAQVHWVEVDGIRLSSEDHLIQSVEHHADHNVGRVSIHFACGSYETVSDDTPPAGEQGPQLEGSKLDRAVDALTALEQEIIAEHDGSDRELRTVAEAKRLIGCCLRSGHGPVAGHVRDDRLMNELGQAAYNAYGDARDWKVVGGGPMPHWTEQSIDLRAAWIAAATRVWEAPRF